MENEPKGQIERKSISETSRLSLFSGRECHISLKKWCVYDRDEATDIEYA
jgi:hypothetical protein